MADDLGYMLDTNIFNHILDGKIAISLFEGKKLYTTHLQRDELNNTPCIKRRDDLLGIFNELHQDNLTTVGAIAGISVVGCCSPTGSDDILGKMLGMLNEINKKGVKTGSNAKDCLIARTALQHGYTLVTNDQKLLKVASCFCIQCVTLKKNSVALNPISSSIVQY